jgi:hypothetical protein
MEAEMLDRRQSRRINGGHALITTLTALPFFVPSLVIDTREQFSLAWVTGALDTMPSRPLRDASR